MNEKLAAQLGAHIDRYPHALEAGFPHVIERLAALWNTPELAPYLRSLMVSNSGGRKGFPPEVATEIFRLANIAPEFETDIGTDSAWDIALDHEHTRNRDR